MAAWLSLLLGPETPPFRACEGRNSCLCFDVREFNVRTPLGLSTYLNDKSSVHMLVWFVSIKFVCARAHIILSQMKKSSYWFFQFDKIGRTSLWVEKRMSLIYTWISSLRNCKFVSNYYLDVNSTNNKKTDWKVYTHTHATLSWMKTLLLTL